MKLLVTAFAGILLLSAMLAWLAGFNFDQRGAGVAYWAFVSLIVASWGAGFIHYLFHKD